MPPPGIGKKSSSRDPTARTGQKPPRDRLTEPGAYLRLGDCGAGTIGRLLEQPIPRASQRLLQSHGGCDKNRYLASFDLLDRSDIQVCQFRQLLLGNAFIGSLSPEIGPESDDTGVCCLFLEHAP